MKKQFKHLPKCTEAYKQQQIQQVLEADVIYEWECDLVEPRRYVEPLWIGGMCLLIMFIMDGYEKYFIFLPAMAILMPVSYFLFHVNERQKCQLTEHGMIVSTVEVVPEIFYTAIRYMAYVGIVACLFAVIFIGPLAFVGAGAGALMAFKMTGFNNEPKVKVFPFLKGLKYMYRLDFKEPMYENGVTNITYKNMELMADQNNNEDDLYGDLRNFHCISYCCNELQQNEIEIQLKELISIQLMDDYFREIDGLA